VDIPTHSNNHLGTLKAVVYCFNKPPVTLGRWLLIYFRAAPTIFNLAGDFESIID